MQPVTIICSKTAVLASSNIDTDQIIPARYLTTTTRQGLGKYLFHDWRFDPEGRPREDFVLNRPAARDCSVLVAGANFGCGSSREHAPWALLDYGFQAVVSSRIADIFHSNAIKNGLVPVVIGEDTHAWLLEHPGSEVEIDVTRGCLTLPSGERAPFPLDTFARYCLTQGVDELGYLHSREDAIARYERERR